MSNSLVFLSKNNIPLTTSLIIAEALERKHHTIIQLIRNHESDLNAVSGRVAFQMQPFETAGGTQNREIAFLNEQQTTLLITFMTNTPKVVKFKIALVKAFYEMRQALNKHKDENNTKHQSYLKIFDAFCNKYQYSNEERAMFYWLKEQALKQGYAIACAQHGGQLKPDEVAIPKKTFEYITKFFSLYNGDKKEFHDTAVEMRRRSETLMLMYEYYEILMGEITHNLQAQNMHKTA